MMIPATNVTTTTYHSVPQLVLFEDAFSKLQEKLCHECTGYIKRRNKSEIALNFAKRLGLCSFCIREIIIFCNFAKIHYYSMSNLNLEDGQ